MMKSLIVYAHPWDGSFNHAILEDVKSLLNAKGNEVDVIDLNKDGFNPVMTAKDLSVFGKGEYADPQAMDYVSRVKTADEIIFIYPMWWYGEPAILNGFFDKVFLKGQVYSQVSGYEITPLLNITKSAVITTASLDEKTLESFGSPIKNRLIGGILKMAGITNTVWFHCSGVHLENERNAFRLKLNAYFK